MSDILIESMGGFVELKTKWVWIIGINTVKIDSKSN